MQHLVGRAKWDADQVRDDVCGYVAEHPHDDRAALVVGETGDVKKGTGTVGVQRQYNRYRRPDRGLPSRRLPGLRRQARPRRSGPGTLRSALLDLRPRPLPRRGPRRGNRLRHQAGAGHSYGRPAPGRRPPGTGAGKFRADILAKEAPAWAWRKLSAGAGAKGDRVYNWAVIDLPDPGPGSRQLLIRRNRSTGDLAHYRCYFARAGAADRAGQSRRIKMAGGGVLPAGQGPGRTRRAPGWPLYLLVPLGHPRRPTRPRHSPPARLVDLGRSPPGPIPSRPLPTTKPLRNEDHELRLEH